MERAWGTGGGEAEFQPPISTWGHTWRTLIILTVSVLGMGSAYPELADDGTWRIALDLALGAVAFGLVFFRRRWPLPIALVLIALTAVSAAAAGPALLATVSVATRRVWGQIAVVGIASVVAGVVSSDVVPSGEPQPWWLTALLMVAITSALLGWGMYIGSRRELLWTLEQRAERAETERDLRVRKARSDERAAIAREMHDVLAHRISQISMHSGALAYRTDLGADELRAGITEVHDRADEALADLRSVLGVLRDPETGLVTNRPQPTYADIGELVETSRAAGARIDLDDRLADRPVPTALGRTLYRIVQEGITNATKHAPGARLQVELSADDGGVDVVLRNPLGLGSARVPGAELGLVGLQERVELAGGELETGRRDGAFVVHASLPWAAA
jgi:signal transduction histidine kinase